MHNVNFQINGETVAGGLADDDLLSSMKRSAVRRQTSRAGRYPSWYGQ
jgi:hypothetical protein